MQVPLFASEVLQSTMQLSCRVTAEFIILLMLAKTMRSMLHNIDLSETLQYRLTYGI